MFARKFQIPRRFLRISLNDEISDNKKSQVKGGILINFAFLPLSLSFTRRLMKRKWWRSVFLLVENSFTRARERRAIEEMFSFHSQFSN